MEDLMLAVYGPLIDKVGGWCLGLIVAHHLGHFIRWFWTKL